MPEQTKAPVVSVRRTAISIFKYSLIIYCKGFCPIYNRTVNKSAFREADNGRLLLFERCIYPNGKPGTVPAA